MRDSTPPAPPIGRFAPSPTGHLHFGSLVAAVASFLEARSAGGTWLVRIEDLDPPREVAGSAQSILSDLARFGLQPDGEVLFQSTRLEAYEEACRRLLASDRAFWCGCSRSELPVGAPYPGTCRDGLPPGKRPRSVRLKVQDQPTRFNDRVCGAVEENLAATSGDFVIRRADGYFAYQLAVVLDDAFQDVSQIVRGQDLLDSTPRQIYLQSVLGLNRPEYAHIPVVTGPDGSKLSKRLASDPVRNTDPVAALRAALEFLGHPPPRVTLPRMLDWAVRNWSMARISAPGRRAI